MCRRSSVCALWGGPHTLGLWRTRGTTSWWRCKKQCTNCTKRLLHVPIEQDVCASCLVEHHILCQVSHL